MPFPHRIDRKYERMITKRFRRVHRLLKATLKRGGVVRLDSDGLDGPRLFQLSFDVQTYVDRNLKLGREDVEEFALEVDDFVKDDLTKRFGKSEKLSFIRAQAAGLSITLDDATRGGLDDWITDNVNLIKSIDKRYFNEVREIIAEGKDRAATQTQLAGEIDQRFKVGKSRAKLIARDQIGKLSAQIDASRNQAAGIKRFQWSSSADERVRDLHNLIDGEIYDYPNGHPTEGLPGQPINCRCVAIPIFDDDDLFDTPAPPPAQEPTRPPVPVPARVSGSPPPLPTSAPRGNHPAYALQPNDPVDSRNLTLEDVIPASDLSRGSKGRFKMAPAGQLPPRVYDVPGVEYKTIDGGDAFGNRWPVVPDSPAEIDQVLDNFDAPLAAVETRIKEVKAELYDMKDATGVAFNTPELLEATKARLEAKRAHLEADVRYLISKKPPVEAPTLSAGGSFDDFLSQFQTTGESSDLIRDRVAQYSPDEVKDQRRKAQLLSMVEESWTQTALDNARALDIAGRSYEAGQNVEVTTKGKTGLYFDPGAEDFLSTISASGINKAKQQKALRLLAEANEERAALRKRVIGRSIDPADRDMSVSLPD